MYNNKTVFDSDKARGPKPDRRFRTTHQSDGKLKNLNATLPISIYGITPNGIEYNGSSLISIFEDLQNANAFSKISIPVFTRVANNPNKPNNKYNHIIGYFKSYNTEDSTGIVTIYDKSIELFNTIKDPVILPRVVVKGGNADCIIGIDIFSKNEVESINKRPRTPGGKVYKNNRD